MYSVQVRVERLNLLTRTQKSRNNIKIKNLRCFKNIKTISYLCSLLYICTQLMNRKRAFFIKYAWIIWKSGLIDIEVRTFLLGKYVSILRIRIVEVALRNNNNNNNNYNNSCITKEKCEWSSSCPTEHPHIDTR